MSKEESRSRYRELLKKYEAKFPTDPVLAEASAYGQLVAESSARFTGRAPGEKK